MTAYFHLMVGQDISYRVRVRECSHCSRSFKSTELAHLFVKGLIVEVQKLAKQNQEIRGAVEVADQCALKLMAANDRIKKLQKVIDTAAKSLLRHRTKPPHK